MRQFPRFPSKYLFGGENGGVFASCKNAIHSVDKDIALVYKMFISSQRKATLVIYRMTFLCGSNSHE